MSRRGNGEGSVYSREQRRVLKDGTVSVRTVWCAAVSLASGKRKVFYARTREEAITKQREAMRPPEFAVWPLSKTYMRFGDFSAPIGAVYSMRDPVTGHCYVGQSRDVLRRWVAHQTHLSRGTHAYQGVLGEAWRAKRLEFRILERARSRKRLLALELNWTQRLCHKTPGQVVSCVGCPACTRVELAGA